MIKKGSPVVKQTAYSAHQNNPKRFILGELEKRCQVRAYRAVDWRSGSATVAPSGYHERQILHPLVQTYQERLRLMQWPLFNVVRLDKSGTLMGSNHHESSVEGELGTSGLLTPYVDRD
jgi:hypothetical protein